MDHYYGRFVSFLKLKIPPAPFHITDYWVNNVRILILNQLFILFDFFRVWYPFYTLENFTISDGSLDSFVFFDFFLYESLRNISNINVSITQFLLINLCNHDNMNSQFPLWCNQLTRFFSGPLWNISLRIPACCIGCLARFSHPCPYQRYLRRLLHTHWQETPPRGEMQQHNGTQRKL